MYFLYSPTVRIELLLNHTICITQDVFRASVKADLLLGQLLRHMRHDCEQLQTLCASTIAHVHYK